MWQCLKCREELEDSFDVCWSCGTSKDGVEDPDFHKEDDIPPEQVTEAIVQAAAPKEEPEKNPIMCPRCHRELDFVGTKAFHEGIRWGVLGDLGELFVNREHFDVYCCPRCGRVEFFVDGIGEQFRPH
jgi:hypothetical protein